MELTSIVTLIDAGTKLFTIFSESWSRSQSSDKKQTKVEGWLSNNYDKLSSAVTDNSARVLATAEYGDSLTIMSARERLHPNLSLSPDQLHLFDQEFHYRLEYLVLFGLLRRGMRDYRITRLGVAFLSAARARGHYANVLKVS